MNTSESNEEVLLLLKTKLNKVLRESGISLTAMSKFCDVSLATLSLILSEKYPLRRNSNVFEKIQKFLALAESDLANSVALEKDCAACGKKFKVPLSSGRYKTYCSAECKKQAYETRYNRRIVKTQMPQEFYDKGEYKIPDSPDVRQIVGAYSETRVVADLILRGFHVFKPLMPSCPCDLIIMRDDLLRRVEVKTGHLVNGFAKHPQPNFARCDVFAVFVVEAETVIYFQRGEEDVFSLLKGRAPI
jgi:predicted transcriptional regulator